MVIDKDINLIKNIRKFPVCSNLFSLISTFLLCQKQSPIMIGAWDSKNTPQKRRLIVPRIHLGLMRTNLGPI